MIRSLLIFLLVGAAVLSGKGQLSIDTTDMPDAPSTFVYSLAAEGNNTPSLGKKGQGVTWDYTDLDRLGQRVDTFFQVSNTPYAYRTKFDNPLDPAYLADHALHLPEGSSDSLSLPIEVEDRYDYYKETSSGYEVVGFGATINGFPTSTKYDPKEVVYPMPLQYQVGDSSYARFVFDQIPGFYYEQERWREDTVDGEGMLITPYATYSNCLRVKTHLTIRDSLKSDSLGVDTAIYRPEKILYEWLVPGGGVPVLRIVERAGVVNRIEYRDTLHNTALASSKRKERKVDLFPDPARSELFLEWQGSEWRTVELWNLRGEKVWEGSIDPDASAYRLNLEGYRAGMYILRLKGPTGVHTEKFVKKGAP